jgi:hypothetical protein
MKLAPLPLEALSNAICGGEGTPIDYRSGEQLRRFARSRVLTFAPDCKSSRSPFEPA